MGTRTIAAMLLAVCVATGCRNPEPVFEEVLPAEELLVKGMEELEGTRILGLFTYVNYSKAIEIFQSIIDN